MRPDFTCSAEKQRKKPYSLDPFDRTMVVPISLSRFLRRYQRIGIQFFYDRYKGIQVEGIGMVKGGILGDDMGLGKTIQVLGFVGLSYALCWPIAHDTSVVSNHGKDRHERGP